MNFHPRSFGKGIKVLICAGVLAVGFGWTGFSEVFGQAAGPFDLPALQWPENALGPVISAQTVGIHYGKHHRTYVDNLNKLVAGTDLAALPLEEVVQKTAGIADKQAIFNNAAQVWNHTFYWHCLKPDGGGKPEGSLLKALEQTFGSFDRFKEEFLSAALGQFGSGWAWLVLEKGQWKIVKTSNADTPIVHGQIPLLTIDVWEHAYYLDYQNRRADHVRAVVENLIDWQAVSQRMIDAK